MKPTFFICPQCGETEEFEVFAEVRLRISHDNDGDYWTEIIADSDEWDDDSSIECACCNWAGTVKQAVREHQEKET